MTRAARSPRFQVARSVLDGDGITELIDSMAEAVLALPAAADDLVLAGIRTRGVPLAEQLATAIEARSGTRPPLGVLDITFYRDDLSKIGPQPVVRGTELPAIEDRTVVLCDDVLFTGRTVRAALDELTDFGRPAAVRLAVMVDRGGRELPIQADVVGSRLEIADDEVVEVGFTATDDADYVRVLRRVDPATETDEHD